MLLQRNSSGLYEFEVEVLGPRGSKRKLRGLVDTGSSECVATYKVVTALKIKPIDYIKISTVGSPYERVLCYSAVISFDDHQEPMSILRVNELPKGIDFILGMSILDKCNLRIEGKKAEISWRKRSSSK